jgi:protein TonB
MRLVILLLTIVFRVHAQEILHTTGPRVIHKVEPEYTEEARKAHIEGTVVLSATVDTDGVPEDIQVLRRLGKGLDESAYKCLQQWRFKPATSHGEPIAQKITVEVNFRMPPSKSK